MLLSDSHGQQPLPSWAARCRAAVALAEHFCPSVPCLLSVGQGHTRGGHCHSGGAHFYCYSLRKIAVVFLQAKATREAVIAIKGGSQRPFLVSRCAADSCLLYCQSGLFCAGCMGRHGQGWLHGQAPASRAAELCVDRLLHQRVRPLQASTSTRRSVTRRRATKHVFSMNTPCTRRSTFLGSGAYAGTWTGGNNATFEGMRWSLPAVFGAGLAGIPLGKWSISSAALLPLSLQPCFSLLALHQSSSSVRRCAAMC